MIERLSTWFFAIAIAGLILAANSGMCVLFSGRFTNAVVETHLAVVVLVGVMASQMRLPKRGLIYGLFAAVMVCLCGAVAQLSFDVRDSVALKQYGLQMFPAIFHGDRAFFPWGWPGGMGCFAAMSAPILFASEVAWLRAIGVAACVALLLLSGSKAALLAACVAASVMVWKLSDSNRTRRLLVQGALSVAVVAIAVLPRHPGEFISSRLNYWKAAILTIADHPWKGVGAGGFGDHFTHYVPTGQYSRIAHCDPLMLAAEHGIWAGALYVGIIGATLCRGLRSPVSCLQSLSLTASLSAFVLCTLVDYPLYAPSLAILAALVAGTIWRTYAMKGFELE